MNLLQLRKSAQERLSPIGDMSARESDWIIEHYLSCDKTYLLTNANIEVSEEDKKNIYKLIDRRLNGEPLQYIIGSEIFMGMEFKVSPDVLIPRFDTEVLVNKLFELIDDFNHNSCGGENEKIQILDIGTGSGIIPIVVAKKYENIYMTAVDISDKALEIAKYNSTINEVEDKIQFIKSNLFEVFLDVSNRENQNIKFDIIVSNPPYIPTDDIENLQIELQYEPKLALDGGKDGYDFYRNIIAKSPRCLKKNGWLIVETGHDQARMVADIMDRSGGFTDIDICEDSQLIQRVVRGRLN